MGPSVRRIRSALLAPILGISCGAPAGCPELCAKEVQCRQDLGVMGPDEAECVETCDALTAEDPAYADAIEERATCIQDESCDAVVFGFACTVDGT